MFKKMTILLISIAIVSIAMAQTQTAIQTDWLGGPGTSGPILNWNNTFDMETGVNWYSSSGELNLAFSSPMEHIIAGGYVRANYACPVDIDGDGDIDILGAAGRYGPPYFFSGRIDWWENTDGSGNNWAHHVVDDDFESAPSISSADLDGDGDMDVIGAARGTINDLAWWENVDSQGTVWTKHIIPSSIQEASSIDTADVNGDGYVDLLSTEANTKVIWMENVDGSGTNWTEHVIGYNNLPYDVDGADIDGDGDIDAVVPAYNGDYIRWWENVDGSGITWNGHDVASDFNGARSVFVADLDGDDDMDILGAASLGWEISWWENSDGYGNSWIEHTINSNFNWAFSVFASDMDEDGDTDVLGAAYFGDDITWWENTDGSGLNWYEHLVDGNFDGARDVVTGDVDGDGDPDIIGAAQEDADITWWDATCCVGSGELLSSILDTETGAQWDSIYWTSEEPSATSIYFQVRSSMDPLYMGNWSANITSPGSLENVLMDGDQYVQYKVFLETTDSGHSPVLDDITISWSESAVNTQEIQLSLGYQFASSRIEPMNPDMLIVLQEILNDDLDFVRDSEGNMLRKIGPNWVNGIGNWISTEGYLFRMNADASFHVSGNTLDPFSPISLIAGYQFISYLPEISMDALIAFDNILNDNLDYIRNSNGETLRKIGPIWVNGIGDVNPGEAYLIKMFEDDILIYTIVE
jgi:hypothetical protein